MARPPKTGLEYFPLDTDVAEDEKILCLEADTGLEGFAIYVKLLATIYRSGYYMMWTETQQKIYSRRFSVHKNTLSDIVSVCNNVGLFNRNLYEKFQILTSHGIQTRYLLASERRSRVVLVKEYCLLSASEIAKNRKITVISAETGVSAYNNQVYACKNPVQQAKMSTKTPQSKKKVNRDVVVVNARARARENQSGVSQGTAGERESGFGKVAAIFSNNIHPITGELEADSLHDLYERYGETWLEEAVKETVNNHGTSIKYIQAILESWERNGFKAPKIRKETARHGNSSRDTRASKTKELEDFTEADENQKYPWDVQSPAGSAGA